MREVGGALKIHVKRVLEGFAKNWARFNLGYVQRERRYVPQKFMQAARLMRERNYDRAFCGGHTLQGIFGDRHEASRVGDVILD